MNFVGEVLLRLLILGVLFVGILGTISSDAENVRALCLIVVTVSTAVYVYVEIKAARSER